MEDGRGLRLLGLRIRCAMSLCCASSARFTARPRPRAVAANNQWRLEEELVSDLSLTSFRKALELCEGAVSIVDSRGVVFSRAWCAKPQIDSRVCF